MPQSPLCATEFSLKMPQFLMLRATTLWWKKSRVVGWWRVWNLRGGTQWRARWWWVRLLNASLDSSFVCCRVCAENSVQRHRHGAWRCATIIAHWKCSTWKKKPGEHAILKLSSFEPILAKFGKRIGDSLFRQEAHKRDRRFWCRQSGESLFCRADYFPVLSKDWQLQIE